VRPPLNAGAGLFAGVDAGGTKVRAAIADSRGRLVARLEGPGATATQEGVAVAADRVASLLSLLRSTGGHAFVRVGLAGGWSPRLARATASLLKRRLGDPRVAVANDAAALLSAIAPRGNAMLLSVGTGVFAVTRDRRGRTGRVDGWGWLAGDEGSGAAIGLAALKAVLAARDGRGPATSLARPVLRALGLARPEEHISRLYAGPVRPRLAALAPLILRAARRGDRVARAILRNAADDIARTVRTGLRKLHSGRATVYVTGGLAGAAPELLSRLKAGPGRRFTVRRLSHPAEAYLLVAAMHDGGLDPGAAEERSILNAVSRAPISRPAARRGLPLTELPNPATAGFSGMSVTGMLKAMNAEDAKVAPAVARAVPAIARAVRLAVRAVGSGGRMVYVGAGTSGRLGILDAAEAPPTFGVPRGVVVAVIAGGRTAIERSIEGAEDRAAAGAAAMRRLKVGRRDIVVGLSASGGAPFVLGALREAARRGAPTAGVTCVPRSPLARAARVAVVPVTGPEALTGSTRLKAGTAQKLVLNMLSTCVFARLGRVRGNLMVRVRPLNLKLRLRAARIASALLGISRDEAAERLRRADWDLSRVVR